MKLSPSDPIACTAGIKIPSMLPEQAEPSPVNVLRNSQGRFQVPYLTKGSRRFYCWDECREALQKYIIEENHKKGRSMNQLAGEQGMTADAFCKGCQRLGIEFKRNIKDPNRLSTELKRDKMPLFKKLLAEGKSQVQIAKALGVSPTTVARWVNDSKRAKAMLVAAINEQQVPA